MRNTYTRLRQEKSTGVSGHVPREGQIFHLKNAHYYIEERDLDGNAPKQFIKVYFYKRRGGVKKRNLKTWVPYIAKTAEKWYPHESIIEYLLNRIGDELGLNMNETKLIRINGQIRFLSRYFLSKDEVLIHGAEICGEYLEDDVFAKEVANNRKYARELFTFQFIRKALKSVFERDFRELINNFVKMLIFDAIVGNNDRHFYNWAVIRSVKRGTIPKFAPIYDTARGLFWNWTDERIVESLKNYRKHGWKVESYLEKAYPRVSLDGDAAINHFDLIDFLKRENKLYQDFVLELASSKNEEKVIKMIKNEFSVFFIKERLELIILVIQSRFERLRNDK